MSTKPRMITPVSIPLVDPTIQCPHCYTEIKLTESLAAPLLKSKEDEFKRREIELRNQQNELRRQGEALRQQVEDGIALERTKLAEQERHKARLELGREFEVKEREVSDLQDLLKSRDTKLAEAQQAQALLVRKQRELSERERELDLTVEKRVDENLRVVQLKAQQETADAFRLQVAEKDQLIQSMQGKIDDLRRKSEQGSQQTRGDVMEADLLQTLLEHCRHDEIARVPKGEFGGDVLHRVLTPTGVACGNILWESKRTRNWSAGWLSKLRADQRTANAEVAVIVSQTLPSGVQHFGLIEGVYVVSPQCVIPLVTMLRQALLELSVARNAVQGRETKEALVYEYLTGPRFRLRVQAIIEAFSTMQDDLNAEKKALHKQWAKREIQLERLMQSTAGMYGDLHGIAGKSLDALDGLELSALDAAVAMDQCGQL